MRHAGTEEPSDAGRVREQETAAAETSGAGRRGQETAWRPASEPARSRRLRAGPSPLRARDGARLRGRGRTLARGGRRGGPRRPAVRAYKGVATTSGSTSPWGGSRSRSSTTHRWHGAILAMASSSRSVPSLPDSAGRLPRARFANRPFYDAIDGLISCYDALGKPSEAADLRSLAHAGSRERIGPRATPAGEGA